MTLEDFRRLAEAWGGDMDRWPAEAREEARKIAATDDGRAILEQESQLDVFASAPPRILPQRVQSATRAVITQLAIETERRRVRGWQWQLSWLVPSASLACSVMLGVALAMSSPYGDSEMGQNVILSSLFDSGSMAGGLVLR